MNDTIKNILERRSIRKYKPDPIPDKELDAIVQCGLYAPNTRCLQSRHILVLKRAEDIKRLEDQLRAASQLPGYDFYKDMVSNPNYSITFGGAPMFAVVTSNPDETPYPEADAALVLGNMFNAAWSLGIGSCWINQFRWIADEPGTRALLTEFGVPDGYRLYGAACFGYPEGGTPKAKERNNGACIVG